jgi:hypothetical protein
LSRPGSTARSRGYGASVSLHATVQHLEDAAGAILARRAEQSPRTGLHHRLCQPPAARAGGQGPIVVIDVSPGDEVTQLTPVARHRQRPRPGSLELEEAFAEATTAERQVLADAFAQSAVASLRDVGVLRHPPTVLDATNRQLYAVATVWAVLSRWDCSLDMDKRLGDELKVLPTDQAKTIVEVLQVAGLL